MVDTSDFVYVSGNTVSGNFSTKQAFDSAFGGSFDAFLCKFSPNGFLVFSTYIGGNDLDLSYALTIDQSDNA